MPITSQLTKQVDLPVWEWMRFSPVTTSSLTALTTAEDGSDRYLYYFGSNVLYKYDTWTDTWQQLSTNSTPVTALSVQHVKNQGFQGQVLAVPTTTTLRIPSTNSNALAGFQIKIISGTGAGQTRTIVSGATETIHDTGLVTTATGNILTDTLKRWKQNQWVGYGAKIVFNTGFSQFREIVYNDQTSLTVFDANYEGRLPIMAAYSSTAPYATPVATAGSQATFAITSQVIQVDSAWTIQPDTTSKFKILSGGIWWITANAGTPFFSFFLYDTLTDRFIQKLTPTGLITAALGTDFSIQPSSETLMTPLIRSTATTSTIKTLVDTGQTMTSGNYVNKIINITGGTGIGQQRRITSNTNNTFTLSSNWTTLPDNTSGYQVEAETDIYFVGNARAQMMKYRPETSLWSLGNILDDGISLNLALIRQGNRLPHGVSTATVATGGITSVATVPTFGGTGYTQGDILTVSTGGALGRVFVESINPQTGAVTQISLYTAGNTYTTGAGKATTGGSGGGCTINILTVGNIGVVTTSINNDIALGETVLLSGATEAGWGVNHVVIGVQSPTIAEIITTATSATTAISTAAAKYTLATNLLVDVTKNWTPNEYTGKILGVQSNSLTGAITWRKILGNSTNTIAFVAGTAPTNGNSRYYIQELEALGKDSMFLADNQFNIGYATSGNTGNLVDSSKNWIQGAFNGTSLEIINPDGTRINDFVTFNTGTQLSYGRTILMGTGTNTVGYSDDMGVTFSAVTGLSTSGFTTSGNCVTWSGTRFVGGGAGTNTLAWSNDGLYWNVLGATTFSTQANALAWNGVRFVGAGAGTNTLAWSSDAVTWNGLGTSVFSTAGNGVAWNGSLWVGVGSGTNTIASSTDGSAFTGQGVTVFSTVGNGVASNGTAFVAVGQGTNSIAYSVSGTSFSGLGTSIFSVAGNGVAWNGSLWVAVGAGTNTIAYSNNGINWTGLSNTIFSNYGKAVAWNGVRWIAVGSGTNTIATSPDGITWSGQGTTIFSTAGVGVATTTSFQSTIPNIGLTPVSGSTYKINDSYGMASTGTTTSITDYSKKWRINQWAGKRVLVTAGSGAQQEATITSNSPQSLAFGALGTSPDITSTYTIIGKPVVSTGIELNWNFGSTDLINKGKYLILPRGGAVHTFDVFDISKNKWNYGNFIFGQGETLTTGSMYAYDGVNRIYFQRDATGRIFYYDIPNNRIDSYGMVPFGMGAAILSNRMEIIQTTDGIQYLYVMRHTGTEMWRTIIYV